MGTSEILLEGPKLAAVLPRLRESGARVVVDHFGLPDPARGVACEGFAQVLEGVRSGDTFVKLSAPYRFGETDPQCYVDALLDAGGPRQLVWASDWPFVSFEDEIRYAPCVRWIRTWIPDEAARRTVLVDTPAALFEFDREPRRHDTPAKWAVTLLARRTARLLAAGKSAPGCRHGHTPDTAR
jgi:predicted TIM-barrel fold metal-dependent hydrolase